MSYCDDCIILDICGKEGCCDDAMTFCSDKHRFIHKSVIDDIKAEIEKPLREEKFFDTDNAKAQAIALKWCLEIIDKHIKEFES